ncbi:MAG: AI-2E family transporter [Candidatus Absconditabacterales bacterium]|nr:AI-2E family transporter [Candidatus Absconditabacterales bacterium]
MKIISNWLNKLKKKTSFRLKSKSKKNELDEIFELKKMEESRVKQTSGFKSYARTNKDMFKFRLFGLLVVVIGYFAYNTLNLIFLLISAFIFSMIVESFISRFQSKKIKRGLSVVLSYFIVILVLFFIFLIFVPFLISQTVELVSLGLNYLAEFQKTINILGIDSMIMNMKFLPDSFKDFIFTNSTNLQFIEQLQTALQQHLSELISFGKLYIAKAGTIIISFVSGFTKFLINFGIFITFAIFFSIDKDIITNLLAKIGGKNDYNLTRLKINKMYKKLGVWFKARLLMSIIVTFFVWLMLVIMGWFGIHIPNKLLIALFIGLLDIIPYIGPFISGLILFLVSMLYNAFGLSLLVTGIYVLLNLLLTNVLLPIFMNKALGVNASLIFIGMVFGGMIMGFFGVLLAVPIMVIVVLLFENKEQLNRKEEDFNISEIVSKSAHKIMKKMPNKQKNSERK